MELMSQMICEDKGYLRMLLEILVKAQENN